MDAAKRESLHDIANALMLVANVVASLDLELIEESLKTFKEERQRYAAIGPMVSPHKFEGELAFRDQGIKRLEALKLFREAMEEHTKLNTIDVDKEESKMLEVFGLFQNRK
jgi:hypothetical protein